MTTDRRKAILFLALTLIIGILIGSMIPAFYARFRHGNGQEWRGKHGMDRNNSRDGRPHDRGKDWVTHVVLKVVKPDSDQVKMIRPITKETTELIRDLEKNSNDRMVSIMDSMKLKLKPILTEEQNKKLEEFSLKARQRWKERR